MFQPMAFRNNFVAGIIELLILSFLRKEDNYIYEISKSIQMFSQGRLSISQNTLYSATYKLENEGYISEYSKKVGRKRVRVYYKLEPSGEEYLNRIRENYEDVFHGTENILKELD